MCVIAYKPTNEAFPEERIFKNCFDNNPDGAGFMYTFNGKVYIKKGYTTFKSFKAALNKTREITGDKVPYVMHFRIATQGYEKTMTHPFPLSSKMANLKKTKYECNIGVAHNGIISLTSDGSKEYSDTMLFITDYLSLIIRNYSWYKDDRTKQLIENLIDASRRAILDKNGHCQLLGQGWVEDGNIWYSNTSYSYPKVVYNYKWNDDYWDWGNTWSDKWWERDKKGNKKVWKEGKAVAVSDPYEMDFDNLTGQYDFDESYCPLALDDDDSYCSCCANFNNCKLCSECHDASGNENIF